MDAETKTRTSTDRTSTDVEMKIRGLVMDPATNMPIVILKDVQGDTVLPIWVGLYEANAIALEIEKSTTPRPMTHDLLRNLISGLNAAVQKVVVTELKNDTFLRRHLDGTGRGNRQHGCATLGCAWPWRCVPIARFMSAKKSSASQSWRPAWRKRARTNCAAGSKA